MIDKAQKEIKKLNQKVLFQKAELKKKHKADLQLNIQETQNLFEENSTQLFNNSLTSTLLNMNENFLKLKIKMVQELKDVVLELIRKRITKNYSKYINYLVNNIKNVMNSIDTQSPGILLFNSSDYEYFKKDINNIKIKELFQSPFKIEKSSKDYIGGFIFEIPTLKLSYNHIIDDIINKKSSIFEIELSKIISDDNIEIIKNNLIEFINNQKTEINILKGHLNNNE